MSFDEKQKRELEEILASMGTAAFDENAKQRMASLINDSDEARQVYLDHCQMQAMLHQSALLASFRSERPSDQLAPSSRALRRPLASWAALALTACMLFIVGVATAPFFHKDANVQSLKAAKIASVENVNGVAFFDDSKVVDGEELAAGMLQVESGSIDVRFRHGTMLLVEGPAELSIDSDMQVSLQRGRLAARVSEDAHGFTVLGPDAAVVDLGTEFAMAVEDGDSWVEVYDGEVDVALLNEDGQAWKSRELTPSGPVRIVASKGQILDGSPPLALPRLAEVIPEGLAVPGEYVKAILRSNPAHYWRFEETDSGQVDDLVGNAAIEILGGTQIRDGGLYFPGGSKHHGLAVVSEPHPSLISNEFTIEAWVNPAFAQRRSVVEIRQKYPDSELDDRLYALRLQPAQHQTIHPEKTFQFNSHLWPYGEEGHVCAFSMSRYRPSSWHHVVAVRHETRVEVYLNGGKAQAAPVPRMDPNPPSTTITIGGSSHRQGERPSRGRYFKGMVDEIAVYPKALSAEEVAEHYRLMQVSLSEN